MDKVGIVVDGIFYKSVEDIPKEYYDNVREATKITQSKWKDNGDGTYSKEMEVYK